ncbi:hypothetical protein [Pseudonocardia sp.]|uniref:hypothetical protein n=1 Tax=Pseudonocardia sp. TaxID=60912 RepID=UPI00262D3809|nr:hypothetical protein [Pseudonocardia sp.]
MDLTARLLRAAVRRPRVLVVPTVGGTASRLAVERELVRRGWPVASGPADADVLAVAGSTGPAMAAVVRDVLARMPVPRARADVPSPAAAGQVLDAAARLLGDRDHQRRAGHDRPEPGEPGMADVGEDRDGLALDRLHVPLGPVLPDWPAGLVLRVRLHGDVVGDAAAELLDAGRGTAFWPERDQPAARELDALARFLGVAGWPAAAARARRLRDELLAGTPAREIAGPAAVLLRRVRRSRTLRWSVRGTAAGQVDVATVLDRRVAAIGAALGTVATTGDAAPPVHRPAPAELAGLVVGAELAAARLVVAALDPDTDGADVADARDGEPPHG